MIALALVALMQQGAAPAPQATRLEVTPTEATAQVGGTVQLRARVLDAAGNVVPNAQVLWFTGGGEGSVSDQGLVTAGYPGKVQVTAVTQKAGGGQVVAQAVVRVLPAPPARVAIAPAVARLIAGTRMSLVGTAYSAQGDVRYDPVRFASSNSAVIAVTPEGALQAVAPGTATLTGRGPAQHHASWTSRANRRRGQLYGSAPQRERRAHESDRGLVAARR
jgi:uncharacterized protein YjdB